MDLITTIILNLGLGAIFSGVLLWFIKEKGNQKSALVEIEKLNAELKEEKGKTKKKEIEKTIDEYEHKLSEAQTRGKYALVAMVVVLTIITVLLALYFLFWKNKKKLDSEKSPSQTPTVSAPNLPTNTSTPTQVVPTTNVTVTNTPIPTSTPTPTIIGDEGEYWGDSSKEGRPSYTSEQINSGALGDVITFNSLVDGEIGNEKNFIQAKIAGDVTESWHKDRVEIQDGEKYTIRMYVHNNSPKGEEAVAEGVKTMFSLPTTIGKTHVVIGYLDCSNSNPGRYWDCVSFESEDYFYIQYVKGSAKYVSDEIGEVILPDEIIISGATIGYSDLDGRIPGGDSGYVSIDIVAYKTNRRHLFDISVRLKDTDEWYNAIWANVGDEIEYKISFTNLLDETVRDIIIRVDLPKNIQYIDGSTYVKTPEYDYVVVTKQDMLITNGIPVGAFKSYEEGYITFSAKIINSYKHDLVNELISKAYVVKDDGIYPDEVSIIVDFTRSE